VGEQIAGRAHGALLAKPARPQDSSRMAAPPALEPYLEPGRKLFAGEAELMWAASRLDGLPAR